MLKSELIFKYKKKWNDACFDAEQLKHSHKYVSSRIAQVKKNAFAEIINNLESLILTISDF